MPGDASPHAPVSRYTVGAVQEVVDDDLSI